MIADPTPLQVLFVTLAGWINRHRQHVIEYLVEENRVLKGQRKGHLLRLTDDQRRTPRGQGISVHSPRSGRGLRPNGVPSRNDGEASELGGTIHTEVAVIEREDLVDPIALCYRHQARIGKVHG